jgi:putative alpha-1,2-mannosidase
MFRHFFLGLVGACLALGLVSAPQAAAQERLVSFVDPFIGSDGTGHTFPGPSAPFGMVQPGPDNAALIPPR